MKIKKMCSFYISNFHLLTILLPYINQKIENEESIELILQNNLNLSVNEYLNNVNIKCINKEKIRKIDWNEKNEFLNNEEIDNVIIIGSKEFINMKNSEISKREIKVKEIINFFNFNEVKKIDNLNEMYDYVLSTKGISLI